MAEQHRNVSSVRRRGTSIAACAIGLSLIAGAVQPVQAAETTDPMEATEPAPETVADPVDPPEVDEGWSGVSYPAAKVRLGQTTSTEVVLGFLESYINKPVHYRFEHPDAVNPAWGAEIDGDSGTVTITPDPSKAEELPDEETINIMAVYKDGDHKIVPFDIVLSADPYFMRVEDRTFWAHKRIKPVPVRALRVPDGATLTIDASTLPEGITADTSRAKGRVQNVYLKGAPTTPGTYNVAARVLGEDGTPLVDTAGNVVTSMFTITVKDTSELPEPVREKLTTPPDGTVRPGEKLEIPVDTENASSVDVQGLPDGVIYDEENSVITGIPKEPGDYDVVVEVITEDDRLLEEHLEISVSVADGFAWHPITVRAGEDVEAAPSRVPSTSMGIRAADDAPEWVTVGVDGVIKAVPPRDLAPGEYKFGVITDDGTRSTVTIDVQPPNTDASRYWPEYRPGYLRYGETGNNSAPTAKLTEGGRSYRNQPLPAGTKFEILGDSTGLEMDKATGVITVTKPRTENFDVRVRITFPDDTIAERYAKFIVDPAPHNVTYQPAYEQNKGAQPGKTVLIRQIGKMPEDAEYVLATPHTELEGWDVAVDLDSGLIRATAPKDNAKPIELQVRALYSDGTIDDVAPSEGEPSANREGGEAATVRIDALTGDTLADGVRSLEYKPVFDAEGNIRITPTGSVPEGTKFEADGLTTLPVELDENTGEITIKVPTDAPADAPFDVPIKLTLPDGSTQEVVVPVTTRSEAKGKAVAWAPLKRTEGGDPTTKLPTAAPEGARYGLAASFSEPGWRVHVDETTGAITAAIDGGKAAKSNALATLIPIVVTFTDGSQRIVEVPATAVRGEAALTGIEYLGGNVRAGAERVLTPTKHKGSFSLVTPVEGLHTAIDPENGVLTVKATPDTLPGIREVPVRISFSDGSELFTSAPVQVLTANGATTLAKDAKLENMLVKGTAGETSRFALTRPETAIDHPFSLGQTESDGWTFGIDHATGELTASIPTGAEGHAKAVPVFVEYLDGSRGKFTVTVEATRAVESSTSSSSVDTHAIGWIAGLLAILGLIGAANYALYENREFYQQFLVWWK